MKVKNRQTRYQWDNKTAFNVGGNIDSEKYIQMNKFFLQKKMYLKLLNNMKHTNNN